MLLTIKRLDFFFLIDSLHTVESDGDSEKVRGQSVNVQCSVYAFTNHS